MAVEIRQFTVEQYLALEAESEIKHEFIDGVLFPMPGGTLIHDQIIMNLTLTLGAQLVDSTCRLHTSHMRVGLSPRVTSILILALSVARRKRTMTRPLCSIPFS